MLEAKNDILYSYIKLNNQKEELKAETDRYKIDFLSQNTKINE